MNTQNLNEIIKQAAKADKRSQSELARAAGMTDAQLSLFLNGKRGLTLSPAARLAAVLGLMVVRRP